jgi:hypothetical protein
MDPLQYYPTPKALGERLWRKFKDKDMVRVLEPSAGTGELAMANPFTDRYRHNHIQIDCCEIDITKHATLRANGLTVVGTDFLEMTSGAIYSQIILNPPFADGVKHVIKAFELLWDGEVAACINAESIRNPYTQERQHLVKLIERFGSVEIVSGAFAVDEAQVKSNVDVALVYLRKEADVETEIVGDLLKNLKRDAQTAAGLGHGFKEQNEVALPNTVIENSVLAFTAAVQAMRESVFSQARANQYASLLGGTMAERCGEAPVDKRETSVAFVKAEVNKAYKVLKDRAWSNILRSSNVTSRLSSAAQKRIESEFQEIAQLDFTTTNIYAFLLGLIESQGAIQIGMVLDVFDAIVKYHTSENAVFYRGWKSNDRHRTTGMRLKSTRFVLPGHQTSSWEKSLNWNSRQLLGDFDKVFALLDGKTTPDYGLAQACDEHMTKLRHGARISSDYLDVRYYPGAGTLHFFPRSKVLMDRLNRIVGQKRQWLPHDHEPVSAGFKQQYEKAEQFDKELRDELRKQTGPYRHDNPIYNLFSHDEDEKAKAEKIMDAAAVRVLERHGIDINMGLETTCDKQLLLAA